MFKREIVAFFERKHFAMTYRIDKPHLERQLLDFYMILFKTTRFRDIFRRNSIKPDPIRD